MLTLIFMGGGAAVPAAPVANFVGTPLTGALPLTVSFTDLSANAPTSWLWDFGDGNTDTAQNPSHIYTIAGSYTVALTATNALGSDTKTVPNYVVVTVPVPIVTTVPPTGLVATDGTKGGYLIPIENLGTSSYRPGPLPPVYSFAEARKAKQKRRATEIVSLLLAMDMLD